MASPPVVVASGIDGAIANTAIAYADEVLLDTLADGLAERGWASTDALLDDETVSDLAEGLARRWQGGQLEAAAVGRGEMRLHRPEIRGDATRWWRAEALGPAESRYWARIDWLRRGLNERLFLGLVDFEAHDAVFEAGAFYHRHLDRFRDADERTLSCLFYLNAGWQAAWGGQLRMHLPEGPLDWQPAAGSFVVFRSDSIWHEVLPADRPRLSIAGWLRRRALGV